VTGQDARVCGVSRGEAQAAYFKRGGSLVPHMFKFNVLGSLRVHIAMLVSGRVLPSILGTVGVPPMRFIRFVFEVVFGDEGLELLLGSDYE
jgi:hypothetical protein